MAKQQEATKEMEVRLMSGESEFSRKALLEQKNKHLEESLACAKAKEKEYGTRFPR